MAPNEALFAPTVVGQLIRYAPFTILNVVALRADLDAEGWLDVNTSIERTFDDATIPVADRPGFFWVNSDALLAIDTTQLTTAPDVPTGAAGAGEPVPVGNRIPVERIALRFEAREVINKAANLFVALPGSGGTLNSMVINNNATFMKVAMTEHLTGTPCGVLHGAIHIAYTVHHPHIRDVNLSVRSNDYSINTGLTDAVTGLPIAGNTNPLVTHVNNGTLSVNPPLTLHKCTYLVTLAALRRLHSGDSAVITDYAQTTFYWEP